MNDETPNEEPAGAIEAPVCLWCAQPAEPGTTLCEECGGPVSGLAAWLPFEATLLEYRMLGRASLRPAPSTMVLLGVWMVTLPSLLTGVLLLPGWWFFSDPWVPVPGDVVSTVLASAGLLLWDWLLFLVAVRTTRHWRATHRRAAPPEAPAAA